MAEKTVYILGAGASVSANLPTQAGLLSLVFSIRQSSFLQISSDTDILEMEINNGVQRIQDFYSKFDSYRQNIGRFILSNFSTQDKLAQYNFAIQHADTIEQVDSLATEKKEACLFKAYDIVKSVNITLEDLFTIFDSVNSGREHFRLYAPKEMNDIHNELKLCIIYALSYSINTSCNQSDYELFCKMLIKERNQTSQKKNTLAVITMNWDDVFENTLHRLCKEHNSCLTKNQQRIYPDLCFYNYDLFDSDAHIPSTHIKAKGHKNIKVLKMHGSLAWLECPKCGRIYTDFSNEIAYEEFSEFECPRCKNDQYELNENPILRSLIITPTFMKSLDNLNIKNIWHNAFIDISEADNLVFIGYSFPDADFEMRCLLKKATKNNVRIKVILSKYDNPQTYIDEFENKGYSIDEAKKIVLKMKLPEEQYKSFFGEENVQFYYNGFGEYVREKGGSGDE